MSEICDQLSIDQRIESMYKFIKICAKRRKALMLGIIATVAALVTTESITTAVKTMASPSS